MVPLGDCCNLLKNRSKFEPADACTLGARALYEVPHSHNLHETLGRISRYLLRWNSEILSCRTSTLYYDYIPLHRVWIVTAAELVQLDQPNHQSYHCS